MYQNIAAENILSEAKDPDQRFLLESDRDWGTEKETHLNSGTE